MNLKTHHFAALLASLALALPATAQLGDALRRARDQIRDARDKIGNVTDAAENIVDGAQGAVTGAGASVIGGSPTEQVARMSEECTAKAKAQPSFNACAVQCSQAAQYLGNVNMDSSSSTMLVDRCTTAYSAAQSAAAAASEARAAESVAVAAATTEVAIVAAPSARYTELRIPSHRSLPRLGLQDSLGLDDQERRNKMSGDMVLQLNSERAQRTQHLLLYIHLLAAGRMGSVFDALDKTRLTTAYGASATPQTRALLAAQQLLLSIGSAGLTPAAYKDYFCGSAAPACAKPTPSTNAPGPVNWGGIVANEFERQSAYKGFGERDYAAAMSWARAVPLEAYQVGRFDVGQYEFEKGAFQGHIYLYAADMNKNAVGRSVSFAREGGVAGDDSYPYSLPMASDAAQRLVESFGRRPRHLYAVTKIRFTRVETESLGTTIYFETASPEIELYTDEALKNKYTTIRRN